MSHYGSRFQRLTDVGGDYLAMPFVRRSLPAKEEWEQREPYPLADEILFLSKTQQTDLKKKALVHFKLLSLDICFSEAYLPLYKINHLKGGCLSHRKPTLYPTLT